MHTSKWHEAYAGKSILVTGGAGAIGNNLTKALGELGALKALIPGCA
jgi:FlaA1/EpsC-like NDP-sugar epimerase